MHLRYFHPASVTTGSTRMCVGGTQQSAAVECPKKRVAVNALNKHFYPMSIELTQPSADMYSLILRQSISHRFLAEMPVVLMCHG